ncbi:MAG TPA: hypothetical protein VHY83_02940 [Solirubrobacteraceae bacterium]|jgi:hypothetical protein|nr:hypothetical protein [Solirubrobacteraceae bacterium]
MLKRLKQLTLGALALGALALGGSALAGAATGSGSSTTTTPATPPANGGGAPGPGFNAGDAPGTPAHENAEKVITGEAAEKAKAAALASVGGGTAGTVTGDFRNSGDYEVEVTKKDGSKLTVRLDSSFKVESHPGPGGPGAPGAPGAPDQRGTAGGEAGSAPAPAGTVSGSEQAPSAT